MEKVDSTLPELSDPEKRDPSTASFDLNDKDEALRLVGLERAETFTEEQYMKVRRKLVSLIDVIICDTSFKTYLIRIGLFLRCAKLYTAPSICMSAICRCQRCVCSRFCSDKNVLNYARYTGSQIKLT